MYVNQIKKRGTSTLNVSLHARYVVLTNVMPATSSASFTTRRLCGQYIINARAPAKRNFKSNRHFFTHVGLLRDSR